jgi:hypothetical protein
MSLNLEDQTISDQDVQMSKEEIAQRRQEITSFYKDSIKHLKVQKEYEELLTAIEESRAKRMQAQMFLAQSLASQEQELQSEENTEDETT